MSFETEFVDIALEDLHRESAIMKTEGWRFIETHAVKTDEGVDLYYAFMKDGLAKNIKITGVTDQPVPSITDLFLAAFVFENEARELFGVDMHDIAIDFAGAMYAPAVSEPMTIITPEQKAAREKARKAAEAKAAKSASEAAEDSGSAAPTGHVFVMTPERRQRLDAKLATMSPEKVAKVEAALKAREAEAAAASAGQAGSSAPNDAPQEKANEAKGESQPTAAEKPEIDAVLEAKLALFDADKAAKIRAVLSGGAAAEAAASDAQSEDASVSYGTEIDAKLAAMDESKADKVIAALAAAKARSASMKEGE